VLARSDNWNAPFCSDSVSITVKKAKISDVFDFLVQEGDLIYSVDENGVLQIGVR
jgi:hypothetical protein